MIDDQVLFVLVGAGFGLWLALCLADAVIYLLNRYWEIKHEEARQAIATDWTFAGYPAQVRADAGQDKTHTQDQA